MKKLTYLMMILILMLSSTAMVACGGGDDDDEDGATAEATADDDATAAETSEETAAATGEETAAPTEEETAEPTGEDTSEATSQPTGGDDLMGMGGLDELDSYRMTMIATVMGMDTEMTQEVINNPPPKKTYMVAEMMGMSTETIQIGDTMWINMGNSWMETTDTSATQETVDFTDQLDIDEDMDYIGSETVNGVKCKHYDVDATVTTTTNDPDTGVAMEVEAYFVGKIWIADESGLPEVMIRQTGDMEMEVMGMNMATYIETDVTDINESFDISAPPADQISDMPDFGDMMGDMEGMEDFDFEDMEGMLEGMDLEGMMPSE